MDVTDILDLARDQTSKTATNLPNTTLIKYLNIVKNDFFSYLITAIDENYNWDYFNTDSVIWQDEYVFPEVAYDSAWILKLKELYISYDWDTYDNWLIIYKKAREVWQWDLEKDWNYYLNYQSKDDPIFYIADNSVFVAPLPDTAVTNWIQARWIKNIPDYTTATTEEELKIPIPYQDILIDWLRPYIFRRDLKFNEANDAENFYKNKRSEVIKKLWNRKIWTDFMTLPDDNKYTSN